MRIAIMGAGSLGTILGAYISRAGKDVLLIDPYEDHVKALNASGAHVIVTVEFVQPVKALTPEHMEGVYDLVIYMAKQTYNATAIPQIQAHIDESSTVCVCQNCIPEYAVSAVIGSERVVGAPVGWGATFQGPGCSALTSDADKLHFTLGSLDGPVNKRVEITKEILECMTGKGGVEVSEKLLELRWCKLLMNATFSGLSTALNTTFGGVLDDDEKAMRLIIKIGNECLDVADANGIHVASYEGISFYDCFKPGNEAQIKHDLELIHRLWDPHYRLTASMAQDLLKGLKCEIREINGVVCDTGNKAGIPTPVNNKVVEIISEMQDSSMQYVCTPLINQDRLKEFEQFL